MPEALRVRPCHGKTHDNVANVLAMRDRGGAVPLGWPRARCLAHASASKNSEGARPDPQARPVHGLTSLLEWYRNVPIQVPPSKRQLGFDFRSWGGRRAGAGRKPKPGRRSVSHRRRSMHDPRCPVHVTMRVASGLLSLRDGAPFAALREALSRSSGPTFRVLHFSVQRDHVHLVVEADAPTGLSRGVQGMAIRIARAVNRALGRRGRVWGDRFHARALTSPREVRNALVYVLNNFRKHRPGARGFDPCSSAAWFAGWRKAVPRAPGQSPVARARTWLASVGWWRHGRIGTDERPKSTA